jgi:hypothetical protein
MTRDEDIWSCDKCGNLLGRHDLWFEGDTCEICNSKATDTLDAYDYDFFLFTQLVYAYGKIDIELEYDYAFEDIVAMYRDFLASKYNVSTKGLYECIVNFLNQI